MEGMEKVLEQLETVKTTVTEKLKEVNEKLENQLSAEDFQTKINEALVPVNQAIEEIKAAQSESNLNAGVELEKEKKNFSWSGLIRGLYQDDWTEEGARSRDVCNEIMQGKTASTATGALGGFLVPDELQSTIVELAAAMMPIMGMGVTTLNGLTSDFILPKVSSRPTGQSVGENEEPTAGDVNYETKHMRPKRVAVYSKISKRLITQAGPVVEQVVRRELAKARALKFNQLLINGTGTNDEIKGLVNISGLTSTDAIGANGGRLTIDKGAEMAMNVDNANMLNDTGSFGYLMAPRVKWGLKRERTAMFSGDTTGAPVLVNAPIMSDAQLESALGYMLRTTTDVPQINTKGTSSTTSDVLFGDWSLLWIGFWGPMEIKASDIASDGTDNAFLANLVMILAQQEADMILADETGFTKITDAEALPSNW